jgi:type II secretory pathway component PulF
VGAGLPFDAALQQLQGGANRYMRGVYRHMRVRLRNAATPADALCGLHLIDRRCHWMIRLYAESSDFAGALTRIADALVGQAIGRTRATFSTVNLVLKFMVAAFIVWTMGSLLGIVQAVKTTTGPSLAAPPPAVSSAVPLS